MGTNATTQTANAHLTTPTGLPARRLSGPRWWAKASRRSSATAGARFCRSNGRRCAKFPIHHTLVRHEQGRGAHGRRLLARPRARLAVAIATSGPARLTWSPASPPAMLDSIPIVCITGNVSSKVLGTDAFQEVDITA